MLLFTIIQIFKETKLMRVLVNTMHIICIVRFTHLYVGDRWFISGHTPWSTYEAIVYVAWATMFWFSI
jgi:ABC-type transport system involved in cytochrome c biogenesis permease subunit